MSTTTPTAGPAAVTFTTEQFTALLGEAVRIARDPETLLLATKAHVQVLHHAMARMQADRDVATRLILALLVSAEQLQHVLPAEFVDSMRGLMLNVDTSTQGYVALRVVTPAPAPGRVS